MVGASSARKGNRSAFASSGTDSGRGRSSINGLSRRLLGSGHDLFGLLDAPLGYEPPGRGGQVTPHEQDR